MTRKLFLEILNKIRKKSQKSTFGMVRSAVDLLEFWIFFRGEKVNEQKKTEERE